jgi:hypothetical protein
MTALKFLIKEERGSALLLTIVIVGILTMLSAAFVNVITNEYRNADWQKKWVQAYYIAEAGMAKAWFTLKSGVKGSTNNLGDFVMGPDGEPNTTDDGILSSATTNFDFGAGNFSVIIADNNDDGDNFSDSDDILMLTSTGVVGNATRMIEVVLTAFPFVPNYAITAGGNVNISGNPTIRGSNGTVHTNINLTISGNPYISQNVIAGGNVNISGNPIIGGTTSSGSVTISIPPIDPGFYRANADYELRSDGGVFDTVTQTLTYPGTFNGWAHSGGRWSLSGNTGYDGTYYIEDDAKVSGNPGSQANPWRVTIIATGSIDISGNPNIQPETPDLLFVAGRDIKISGNPNTSYEGVILAHEQIQISGNPSMEGAIIAEDAENIDGSVTENKISGNVTITYNGNLLPPLPKVYTGQLGLLNWH